VANWPDHKRVAVCLSWDVDGEAAQYVRYPDRARRHLSELHQRWYGPRVGIYKVLDLLERHGVPGTFYIPGYTARQHPDMVRAIHGAGHPIGLHGYLHESLDNMDEVEEEAVLVRARAILADITGTGPTLYRAPSWELNRWTPALLVKSGVRSDSSLMDAEEPYALDTAAGPLVEIPIQWLLDDAEYWLHTRANRDRPIADPDAVFRLWSTEFDGYYTSGGAYVLTLHPFVSGRWAYLAVVERLIRHIAGHPGVWWATMEDVTRWAEAQLKAGALPRVASPPPEPVP
jgi:peptidoglycan/xylan/chitin deacetylase (PgdA/CDA1 family)